MAGKIVAPAHTTGIKERHADGMSCASLRSNFNEGRRRKEAPVQRRRYGSASGSRDESYKPLGSTGMFAAITS